MIVNLLKKCLCQVIRAETGQTLPVVLAMLALGSLILVPSLNYASSNLKGEQVIEKKVKALYTAEAGIEDAIWRVKYTDPTLPYSYQLTDVNGISASVVIETITAIAGEDIGPVGVHGGWLKITKTVVPDGVIYSYTLTIENNGAGNMKIEEILIDFPPGLEYVDGSTSGPITSANPTVIGSSEAGITLVWHVPPPYYTLGVHDSVDHFFQLSGPPGGVDGVEGHSFVRATREDVGTVWDSDSRPYSITSQARDAGGALLATLKVGIWKGTSYIEISCWQINP